MLILAKGVSMQNNEHQAIESRAAGKTAKHIQSVSMATAALLFSAVSAFGSVPSVYVAQPAPNGAVSVSGSTRPLPGPLVLDRADSNQQLIAQHDSHASHGSHNSHGSHSSHGSHHSHASHTSGL
jgi:hypothetical protein